MKNLFDDSIIKIFLESRTISSKEDLKNPEILNFITHEFRFLSSNKNFYFARNRALFEFLIKNNISLNNKKILDIGCGDCLTAYLLQNEHQANVLGVDIQKYTITAKNLIKKLFNTDIKIKIIKQAIHEELAGQVYDLIFLLDLVEHLDDPQVYLINLKNLLKKNGKLIILFPPYYSASGGHRNFPYLHYLPPFFWKLLAENQFKYRDYHLNKITVRAFENIIKNEFKIIRRKMTYLGGYKKNLILDNISKLPLFREILFSWLYILEKK